MLYDKEEFDTDCSQDFLKSLNRILMSFSFRGAVDIQGEGGGGGVGGSAK